jgi:hypothetical protein
VADLTDIGGPVRVGRYELLGEIGRGGMATVHLARQLDLDRLVALKQLDGLANEGDVRVRRFVQEARLAGSLNHPNIVMVHDAFDVDGLPYIAMEFVPGGTLRGVMTGLTLEQSVGVLDGVLAGLEHAERREIVHRDLKPENLLVTAEGGIKITDFGIAKATSAAQRDQSPLTTAGVAIGTPAYMAPEQAMATEIGRWTDLYAVGIIAFELLTGRVPFGDGTTSARVLLQHVNQPPPAVDELRPSVDGELSDWVATLLEKSPRDRPRGAAVAREQLEDVVLRLRGPRWRRDAPLPFMPAPLPASARAPTTGADRTRPGRRPPPVTAPAAAAAAAAGAVAESPRTRARRPPRGLVPIVIAGLALVMFAVGIRSVGSLSPASTVSDTTLPASTVTPQATTGTPTPVASATATATAAATAPAATAAPTAAAQPVDPIRVDDAEREYRRFSEEAQDTEGDGDERLTQLLRNTAFAYRDAVTAGTAGDANGFGQALARADQLAEQATARLDD